MAYRFLVVLALFCFTTTFTVVNSEFVSDRIVGEIGNPSLRGSVGFLEAGEQVRGDENGDDSNEENSASDDNSNEASNQEDENEIADAVKKIAEEKKEKDGDDQKPRKENSEDGEELENMLTESMKKTKSVSRLSGETPAAAKTMSMKDHIISPKSEKPKQKAAPKVVRSRKKRTPWTDFVGSLEPTGVASKCTTTCRKSRRRKAQICETLCEPIIAAEHMKPKNAL